MSEKTIRDVAFSCDDNGARFLDVAVWSLLEHYLGEAPLRVNVFEGWGGHSAEHKEKLRVIVESFNTPGEPAKFSLRYHEVEKYVEPYADLILNREKSRWNVFTWTPIFTPQVLEDAAGPCIHFDIDMLFNADISPLFEVFDGSNNSSPLIACTMEYDCYGNEAGKVIWEKGILPRSVERYFNTGVLVFNTEACRAEKTWEKIIAWYREHYEIADRIEQDAWNALYHDRCVPLGVEWNFHDRNIKGYAKRSLGEKYWLGNRPVECLMAALEPKLLHFWGPKKPWKKSHRPYRRLYHEAMAAVGQEVPREELFSPYHNFINARNLRRIALKLGRAKPLGKRVVTTIRRALRFPFEWAAIGLGVFVLSRVTEQTMFRIVDFAAALMYRFDRHGRRLALENLRILRGLRPMPDPPVWFDPEKAMFDPTRREAVVLKRSYRNMARTVGHIFWTYSKPLERTREVGIFTDRAKAFLEAHHPAVAISAHVGCWEIMPQIAHLEGHRVMSVAKDIGTDGMTRMLMKGRESLGQTVVRADGAFRSLIKGIREGLTLGLLVDQPVDPAKGAVWVWFLGRPLPVSPAPAFFAQKAKAPIGVFWARPLKDGRYRLELLEEISVNEKGGMQRVTQRCTAALERIIRRHPSCWVMNYDFFRYWPRKKDMQSLEDLRHQS